MLSLRELLTSEEKEELKSLGAIFDKRDYRWKIPKDKDVEDFEKYMTLTIDMTIRNDWKRQILEIMSEDEYEFIKKGCHSQNNYTCVVCGDQGEQWKVECHENWTYDRQFKIQTLKDLTSLCPKCHKIRHLALDNKNIENEYIDNELIEHFIKVNNCTVEDFQNYYSNVKKRIKEEEKYFWVANLNTIATIKMMPPFAKDYYEGEELRALLTDINNYTSLDVKLISDYQLQKKINKFSRERLANNKPLKGKMAIRTKLIYNELLTSIKFLQHKT